MVRSRLKPVSPPPRPLLRPLGPEHAIIPVRITRTACLLGSHDRMHLPLRRQEVSRCHALIVAEGHASYVRDLASRNGVYVNGTRVREAALRDGDVLTIRPWSFRWSAPPAPGPLPRSLAPPPPQPSFALRIAGRTSPYPVFGRTVLIGRRSDCDVIFRNEFTAAVHAVIYRRADRHVLRDLNSSAGTHVNGQKVRECELHEGDEIRIGVHELTYEPGTATVQDVPAEGQLSMTGPAALEPLSEADETAAPETSLLASRVEQAFGGAIELSPPTIEDLLGPAPEPVHFPHRPRSLDLC